jgi:hypothetical protein
MKNKFDLISLQVKSNGEIDEAKMESAFVKASPAAWQPIVKEAFSTCSDQYKSKIQFNIRYVFFYLDHLLSIEVKQASLPSPITSLTGRTCKYGPALFMSCIRGHLTLVKLSLLCSIFFLNYMCIIHL